MRYTRENPRYACAGGGLAIGGKRCPAVVGSGTSFGPPRTRRRVTGAAATRPVVGPRSEKDRPAFVGGPP